jgi:hypothetical protein
MKNILGEFPSSSHPGRFYQVVEIKGNVSCNCPPWIFNRRGDRTCKHTDAILRKNPNLKVRPVKSEERAPLPEGFVHPLMKGLPTSKPTTARVKLEEVITKQAVSDTDSLLKEFKVTVDFLTRVKALELTQVSELTLLATARDNPKAGRKLLRAYELEKPSVKLGKPSPVSRRSL